MPVITAARRSAVAPRGGALSHLLAHQLAAPVIAACLADAGLSPGDVDEVIVSNALGAGGNPARLCALEAGLPERVAGLSLDRQCAGGLDALLIGHAMILSGQAEVVIAGGVESYSTRPLRARGTSEAPEFYDAPPFAPNPADDPDMAEAADALGIPRDRADQWAVESHARAVAARAVLDREIVAIGDAVQDDFTRDLSPRAAARAPVTTGGVTHANTAVAADAAAFVILQRDPRTGLARLLRGATRGASPRWPGLAPLAAIDALRPFDPPDHVEVMEAYAAQAIAVVQGADLDPVRVNRQGGALARGHPIGASGAILAVRLAQDIAREGGTGLAAIAAAGGIATAALFAPV